MLNDGADRITQAQDGADGTYVLFTTSGHVSRHPTYFAAKDHHDRELPDEWACIARGGKALAFLWPHGREALRRYFDSRGRSVGTIRGTATTSLALTAQPRHAA